MGEGDEGIGVLGALGGVDGVADAARVDFERGLGDGPVVSHEAAQKLAHEGKPGLVRGAETGQRHDRVGVTGWDPLLCHLFHAGSFPAHDRGIGAIRPRTAPRLCQFASRPLVSVMRSASQSEGSSTSDTGTAVTTMKLWSFEMPPEPV